MSLNLTYFAEYMSKPATQRTAIARRIVQREESEYEFAADYYGPLRSGIQKFHRNGSVEKKQLDAIPRVATPARRSNYEAAIKGYKKFLGRKVLTYFKPKRVVVHVGGLDILVNPEIGLAWGGEKRAIKLIFNKDIRLTKSVAALMLAVMGENLGKGVVPCVLDMKAGRIFEGRDGLEGISELVEAEAMSLKSLLDSTRNQ